MFLLVLYHYKSDFNRVTVAYAASIKAHLVHVLLIIYIFAYVFHLGQLLLTRINFNPSMVHYKVLYEITHPF